MNFRRIPGLLALALAFAAITCGGQTASNDSGENGADAAAGTPANDASLGSGGTTGGTGGSPGSGAAHGGDASASTDDAGASGGSGSGGTNANDGGPRDAASGDDGSLASDADGSSTTDDAGTGGAPGLACDAAVSCGYDPIDCPNYCRDGICVHDDGTPTSCRSTEDCGPLDRYCESCPDGRVNCPTSALCLCGRCRLQFHAC